MEIKRPVSKISSELQETKIGENQNQHSAEKPSGIASVADSIEVAKETGRFSAAKRFDQQPAENTGNRELTPEQEQRASEFATEDLEKPDSFVQTSESKHKESENSGLQAPFTRPKSPLDELKGQVNEDRAKAKEYLLESTLGNQVEDKGNALVDNVDLRDLIEQEQAERHSEFDLAGSSPKDRLSTNVIPDEQQDATTFGKDMIAQKKGEVNAGYGYAVGYDSEEGVRNAGGEKKARGALEGLPIVGKHLAKMFEKAEKAKENQPDTPPDSAPASPNPAPSQPSQDFKSSGKLPDGTEVKTGKDGTTIITKPDKSTTVMKKDGSRTVIHADGSFEDFDKNGKKVGSGDAIKSLDFENYSGNVPPEVKKQFEYLRAQYRLAHQDPGGHEVQEDPNSTKGGKASDDGQLHVFELGNTGLVGQPDTTRESGSLGGSTQPGGASGGDIDFGPDSLNPGFTGTPHQDNPGDIQFGPAERPEQLQDPEEEQETQKINRDLLDHNK